MECKYFEILKLSSVDLGIEVAGGSEDQHIPGDNGIFITRILKGGTAEEDGRLAVGDRIIKVNDTDVRNITKDEASRILNSSRGTLKMIVSKPVAEFALTVDQLQRSVNYLNTDSQCSACHVKTESCCETCLLSLCKKCKTKEGRERSDTKNTQLNTECCRCKSTANFSCKTCRMQICNNCKAKDQHVEHLSEHKTKESLKCFICKANTDYKCETCNHLICQNCKVSHKDKSTSDISFAQHFVECLNCKSNAEFCCKSCGLPLCEKCKKEHEHDQRTEKHIIVPYGEYSKIDYMAETCQFHPFHNYNAYCEECKVPVCIRCVTDVKHRGHTFEDSHSVYERTRVESFENLKHIRENLLAKCMSLCEGIDTDIKNSEARTSAFKEKVKAEVELIKQLLDIALKKRIEEFNSSEEWFMETLNSQKRELSCFITYLKGISSEYEKKLYSKEFAGLLEYHSKIQSEKIKDMPVLPLFSSPFVNERLIFYEDVSKLLSTVSSSRHTGRFREVDKSVQDSSKENILKISPVRSEATFYIHGLKNCDSIDVFENNVWMKKSESMLVRLDRQWGAKDSIEVDHVQQLAIANCGEVFYTDSKNNRVMNLKHAEVHLFVETKPWRPDAICASRLTNDILVGLKMSKESKIVRINEDGKTTQGIQFDNFEKPLYSSPHYIAENVNGDICVSDKYGAVVVVDKTGVHRFSYYGQPSAWRLFARRISPLGLCTDVMGHIIVCDQYEPTIHVIDKNGQFISFIKTLDIKAPRDVSVDNDNNLWVVQDSSDTLRVYHYLSYHENT
ncbi:uncharacterized protein LOC133197968 [Saccostrea echinata]|uniref:uncharacterized protein LOC133197968 n=1 Tax=Saccostrea echinata TaxID=191078 RepID=UPI002A804B3F|nr:uncharacterized protein LOC133197968 [Saccostrea echinata]